MNRPGAVMIALLLGAVIVLANEQILWVREWVADRRYLRAKRRDLDRGVLPDTWHPRNAERLRNARKAEPPPWRSQP